MGENAPEDIAQAPAGMQDQNAPTIFLKLLLDEDSLQQEDYGSFVEHDCQQIKDAAEKPPFVELLSRVRVQLEIVRTILV
jgi:hypothetical protein